MITELDVVPVFSGVVYSPGWTGWKFYPEEQLFVGQTGGGQNQTYIRSVIVFSLPDLPPGAILLKAFLRLRITRNEPLDVQKHICLREAPRNPHATWSIDEELSMPFVSEHHLSTEIGLDLDFELTAQVDVWRDGGPNNGIVLNQASFSQSLVAFAGAGASGPQPTLKLAYVLPSSRDETVTMWVGPDTAKDSQ